MATVTSFQKKNRSNTLKINGTKPSLHKNQLLVSTGIPSLDNLIGGGLGVGTVLLIEEDVYANYSKLMLKYFLAEGAMSKHKLLVASADVSAQTLIESLPAPVIHDPVLAAASGDNTDMKIAWRYQTLPQFQSSPAAVQFGHYYDLTRPMTAAMLTDVERTCVDTDEGDEEEGCASCQKTRLVDKSYARLLTAVKKEISEGNFSTSTSQQKRNILRIGVHSLASPQWHAEGGRAEHPLTAGSSICRFLYALRAMLRCAFAVAVITMPTHLFQDSALCSRVEHLCDTVVRLRSFVASNTEKNEAFKEYDGLFTIAKLARLNTLAPHQINVQDLVFKLRRKKFTIEKLHLPPELSDSTGRSQEDVSPSPSQHSSPHTTILF